MTRRRKRLMLVFTAAVLSIAGLGAFAPPLIVQNTTPSVRMGFYRLSLAAPGEGRLVLFPAPAILATWAPAAGEDLNRHLIIKPVIAGPGRRVCADHGSVEIDGVGSFAQAATDEQGNPLPQYQDCRPMAAGEYFTLSTRIANSLDSRYYGPVSAQAVRGVYVPLWTPDFMQ